MLLYESAGTVHVTGVTSFKPHCLTCVSLFLLSDAVFCYSFTGGICMTV